MRRVVKKYFFADPDKKVGDLVTDQLGQEFRVVEVSETEITLELVYVLNRRRGNDYKRGIYKEMEGLV